METCNLFPAIVQKIDKDNVEVFSFKYMSVPEYKGGTCCSATRCGLRIVSYEFALKLLLLGEAKITMLYEQANGYEEYDKLIENAYNTLVHGNN